MEGESQKVRKLGWKTAGQEKPEVLRRGRKGGGRRVREGGKAGGRGRVR